jgi:hypothetical protein
VQGTACRPSAVPNVRDSRSAGESRQTRVLAPRQSPASPLVALNDRGPSDQGEAPGGMPQRAKQRSRCRRWRTTSHVTRSHQRICQIGNDRSVPP